MATLALMLVAVSLFAGIRYAGPIVGLNHQQTVSKQTADVVRKALWGFVLRNNRLPCPALGNIAQGANGEGLENCAAIAANPGLGVVPWKTIGLQGSDALDAWGSRVGYFVSPGLISGTPYKTAVPSSSDAISISANGGTASLNAYLLISYGIDQKGAWMPNGHQNPLPSQTVPQRLREMGNTTSPYSSFVTWPYNVTNGSTSYFDDWLIFETSLQLCSDVNANKPTNKWTTCSANANNSTAPPAAIVDTHQSLIMGAPTGGQANTYSCSSGNSYCPGAFNAGSAANTSSIVGSGNGTTFTPAGNGNSVTLVGNTGFIAVGGAGTGGISLGNVYGQANGGGDWVGANAIKACAGTYGAGWTQNYLPPGQPLYYEFTNSYQSFTFVDYLVDGGMQVQVDGYAAPIANATGNVTDGSPTVTGVSTASQTQTGLCGATTTPAPIAFAQGQNIAAGNDISSGITINGIVGSQITLSGNASVASATDYLVAAPAGTTLTVFTGDVTGGSNVIANISSFANVTVGQPIAGISLPSGATITAANQVAGTITLSNNATASQPGSPLFTAPAGKALVGFSGTVSRASASITNVASLAGLAANQVVYGPGFHNTISAVGGTTVTLASGVGVVATDTAASLIGMQPFSNFTGSTTLGSVNLTNVANIANIAAVTVANLAGQAISGPGIRAGTTIVSGSGTTLVLSQPATATTAGQVYFATPWAKVGTMILSNGHSSNISHGISFTGNISSATPTQVSDVSSIAGLTVGTPIAGQGIQPGTTITAISGGTVGMSASANAPGSNVFLMAGTTPFTGTLTNNGLNITNVPSVINLAAGQSLTGLGVQSGATIQTVTGGTLTLSLPANVVAASPGVVNAGGGTLWQYAQPLFAQTLNLSPPPVTGNITLGSTQIANLSATAGLAVGQPITGLGIPSGTVIKSLQAAAATLNLSQAANVTATGVSLFVTPLPPLTALTGSVTAGSNSITGVSPASALTTPTQSVGIGQSIIGAGIPTGTIITAINGTTLTLSNKANALASATQPEPLWPGSVAQSVTGTVTKGSTTISAMSSTAGLVPGQSLIGLGIPTGSTIATVINGSSVTISQPATATTAATPLYQPDTGQPISGITGNLSCSGATNTVSNVSSTTSMASGQSISNPNIEIGTKIAGLPSTTTLTLSQAPLAALTNANLVVGAEPRLTSLAITGSTDGTTATLTGLSPSALPAVGQAVSGQGIPAGTVITAVDGTPSLTLSLPVLSPGNNLPLTGSFNGCVNPTGTVSAATPTKVTNLNCIAGLAVGQSISSGNNFHSGTTIQAITVGPATLSQTTSSAQSGTNLFTTYPSCPGPTKTYSGAYSGWMSGGLYQAPVAYPATSTAPSVQHPSAAAANIAAAGGSPAQMASQIWPQPGTAGTGLSSANSNRGALQGNYLDQRDNQFNNIQFIDDLGNPFFVNIVVYQALPYIYANNNSIYQYCMLFEGMKGCYRDVYTSDCTFQGNDEWGNPPVAVTADCNQHPW